MVHFHSLCYDITQEKGRKLMGEVEKRGSYKVE